MASFNENNETFAYLVGKDIAALQAAISSLGNGGAKVLRFTIPAIPERYNVYNLTAKVVFPDEFKNSICIRVDERPYIINIGESLEFQQTTEELQVTLIKLYKLSSVNTSQEATVITKTAEFEKSENTYKYLAKLLTDKYLNQVRAKTRTSGFESRGIKAYVNKNGLDEMLKVPFEMNTNSGNYKDIKPSIYADAKAEIARVKAKIDGGEIDPSSAKDFNVESYRYEDYDEL